MAARAIKSVSLRDKKSHYTHPNIHLFPSEMLHSLVFMRVLELFEMPLERMDDDLEGTQLKISARNQKWNEGRERRIQREPACVSLVTNEKDGRNGRGEQEDTKGEMGEIGGNTGR